jgi:hypothetical protein
MQVAEAAAAAAPLLASVDREGQPQPPLAPPLPVRVVLSAPTSSHLSSVGVYRFKADCVTAAVALIIKHQCLSASAQQSELSDTDIEGMRTQWTLELVRMKLDWKRDMCEIYRGDHAQLAADYISSQQQLFCWYAGQLKRINITRYMLEDDVLSLLSSAQDWQGRLGHARGKFVAALSTQSIAKEAPYPCRTETHAFTKSFNRYIRTLKNEARMFEKIQEQILAGTPELHNQEYTDEDHETHRYVTKKRNQPRGLVRQKADTRQQLLVYSFASFNDLILTNSDYKRLGDRGAAYRTTLRWIYDHTKEVTSLSSVC